jgi:hypothetical protein
MAGFFIVHRKRTPSDYNIFDSVITTDLVLTSLITE